VNTAELAAKIEAMEPTDKLTLASVLLEKAKEAPFHDSRLAYLRLARGTLSQVVNEIDAVVMYESLRRATG
jgi:hypothetical protein